MKITWVTRSFLDYRIPVYQALDDLCGHQLTVIFNGNKVPTRCQEKLRKVLGQRAIALDGEIQLRSVSKQDVSMANTIFRISLQKGLIKTIIASKPQVLISDGFFQWTYASLIVRMFNRKKIKHIMCYERTPHTERNAGTLRTLYRKFVSRWIDAIDCNGSLTAKYITETIHYDKPLAYGHMVADTEGMAIGAQKTTQFELDSIRKKYALNGLTFIYVGRLIPLKGIMELIKAWQVAALQDATLLLVGNGEQQNEIQAYLEENHIENVKLTGSVDYDELAPYYKVADCFIIPTLEDNWSLVVPEAMATGLPVACSIYNGCYPELVQESNGWTFDPLNLQNTVNMLKTISDFRDKLKYMGEASREIVANHTPQHAAQALYDACKKIINN